MKILMVCLGNICRSPLAQGILENKVSQNITVDSAGTANYHVGRKPDARSIETAKKYSIDISNQRARQFKKTDLIEFDLIFAMDKSNYYEILSLTSNEEEKQKVKLILDEHPEINHSEVPDPYYGGNEGFELVFDLLDKVCDKIIENYNLK